MGIINVKLMNLLKTKNRQETPAQNLPKHIAIIMDGNGRWAKEKNLPTFLGYFYGAKALTRITKACNELQIPALTVYTFGVDNWKRDSKYVAKICRVIHTFVKHEKNNFLRDGVRLKFIGDISRFEQKTQDLFNQAQELTKDNKRLTLTFAVNYSGTWDITNAVKKIQAANKDNPVEISEELITNNVSTHDLPPLDLIIRTSGELRLSNFLLWQAAYAELYFTNVLWPDFDEEQLKLALESYQKRERRFGAESQLDNKK